MSITTRLLRVAQKAEDPVSEKNRAQTEGSLERVSTDLESACIEEPTKEPESRSTETTNEVSKQVEKVVSS